MTQLTEKTLIAYLDGELTANEAKRIEQLLHSDSLARAQYERLLRICGSLKPALAQQPIPEFGEQVILKIHSSSKSLPPARLVTAISAAAVLAVASVLFFVFFHPGADSVSSQGEFSARSATSGHSHLTRLSGVDVYLHENSDPLRRKLVMENTPFGPEDGFSFVVHNRTQKRCYLMIVALDAEGQLHWFYPSGSSDLLGRESIPVEAAPSFFPLPEGVTPGRVARGRFQLIALMTQKQQTVDTVDQILQAGGLKQLQKRYTDASIQIFNLKFLPAKGPPQSLNDRETE